MEILIIKLDALGDVLRTISILPAIKNMYPKSKITWFTKKNAYPFFINNSLVDKVLIYSKNNINSLLMKSFDLVINLDEDFEACSLATRIRKRKLVGFYIRDGKVVPTSSAYEIYNMSALGKKPQNDILKKKNKKTYQQLISELVGVDYNLTYLNYELNKEQIKFAKDFKRRYNINKNDLIIGINTGSGDKWPSKRYSVQNTAKLAEKLYKELNAKIILFGGPEEIQRNNDVIALAKVPIINTGCGNDLVEFPALISICRIFITSDTLGLHLAVALKREIIALFGPTSAAEIDLYELGVKIIPDHKCYCCYKPNCEATDSIKVNDIMKHVNRLLKDRAAIVVTAFKEPNLNKTIDSILNQNINYYYDLIISAPDIEAEKLVKTYQKKYKNIQYFKDPGTGKSFALNLLFKKFENEDYDLLVFSDGDVILGKDSMNKILDQFKDLSVGCVTGRVVSANSKNNLFGYWSHLLADAGAHNIRKKLSEQNKFLECSGYLFAFRSRIIKNIPLDVAEDSIIPYYFWKRGYLIKYASEAKVYVKNPDNFEDWLKQRNRTAKAHETLINYAPDFPRVKSFSNEILNGTFWALQYPDNLKEFYWTMKLFFARFYMWMTVFYDTRLKKKHYGDAWERVESTKL